MSISRKLKGAASGSSDGGGGSAGVYVDDVFSTYVYEGNSVNDRPIVNGIDLAGEGGLVWLKHRSGTSFHYLYDTERGTQQSLSSNDTGAAFGSGLKLKAFNSDGFDLGGDVNVNNSGEDYASWTFRKAKNFFDVVTYSGTSVPREIPHSLGVVPGMIVIKDTSDSQNWVVWHNSSGLSGGYGYLNTESQFYEGLDGMFFDSGMTDSVFKVSGGRLVNQTGRDYVAYVFAHDDSDESMIKCGSYTGSLDYGSGGEMIGPKIDLGFEPQWLLIKCTTTSGNWAIFDCMRGIVAGGDDEQLSADLSDPISVTDQLQLTATGFRFTNSNVTTNSPGDEYVYMAIRRPNKPADEFEADDVFANIEYTGTGVDALSKAKSEFPVDFAMHFQNLTGTIYQYTSDRLTAGKSLVTNSNAAEVSQNQVWDVMDGVQLNSQGNSYPRLQSMWRRAPGFFDVVAYEGDGQAGRDVPHNLGVAPEMMWVKSRTGDFTDWFVYAEAAGAANNGEPKGAKLNEGYDFNFTPWQQHPTDESFHLGVPIPDLNTAGNTYIAYLFASVPGISKIGSYTGNGSEVEVDCGFTTGARWLLVKRADSTGDWYFTCNPNNFQVLAKLNTTDAQSNYMSTYNDVPAGFRVTSTSDDLCVDGAEYIFYAIA